MSLRRKCEIGRTYVIEIKATHEGKKKALRRMEAQVAKKVITILL